MATDRPKVAIASGVAALLVVGGIVVVSLVRDTDPAPTTAPHFVDETASSGIDHEFTGGFDYFVGGGVAAFDCDEDGLDDLYFAGGTAPAALYRNESAIGGALRLAAEPSPVTDLTEVTGAYPLDIDSDGIVDLVVLRNGPNVVLRGLGDCRFEDVTDTLGVEPGDDRTVAFSAVWEVGNDLPTMAFGNYLVPGTTPDNYACADSQLVRPDPGGEGYAPPVALSPGYCTLSMLFSDWSRNGERDLRVSNDRHYYVEGHEQLWRVVAGEAPREYTEADGWRPLQVWGMGIASEDLTGDGRPEVYLTSQGDNKLQALDDDGGEPAYHDIALDRGVIAQRPFTGGDVLPSTAWHAQFDDVNNDGFADLLVTKGNVDAEVDMATRDPSNLLLGRPDGTFVEGAEDAGIVSYDRARGAAMVDLNGDGLLDLVVVNRMAPAKVWRNVGVGDAVEPMPMGHWLGVRLEQPAPNVDAIGSWIEVRIGDRVVQREVTVGGGHASGQLGPTHFGLGDAEQVDVRVQWPNGEIGEWVTVDADQVITMEP